MWNVDKNNSIRCAAMRRTAEVVQGLAQKKNLAYFCGEMLTKTQINKQAKTEVCPYNYNIKTITSSSDCKYCLEFFMNFLWGNSISGRTKKCKVIKG